MRFAQRNGQKAGAATAKPIRIAQSGIRNQAFGGSAAEGRSCGKRITSRMLSAPVRRKIGRAHV